MLNSTDEVKEDKEKEDKEKKDKEKKYEEKNETLKLSQKAKESLKLRIMTRTVLQRESYGKSVSKTFVSNLAVTIEDYGSEKPLPHYGLNRPNADYFNSSIHLRNMNVINPSGRGSSIFL